MNSQASCIQHEFERIRFTIRYRNTTALTIGTGTSTSRDNPEKTSASDKNGVTEVADICLTGDEKPYIPSTSLRGLFRHLSSNSPALQMLFGQAKQESEAGAAADQLPKTTLDGDHSRIRIYDAIGTDNSVNIERSTHVSIDPKTRTANEGLLFQRQFIQPGACFEQVIEADRLSASEADLFTQFIHSLNSTDLRIGAGANRMMGALSVEVVSSTSLSLDEFATWLTAPDTTTLECPTRIQKPATSAELVSTSEHISMTLNSYDALFIYKAMGTDGQNNKTTNELTARKTHDGKYMIPASTLLGGFRSHVRYLVLTLLRHQNPQIALQTVTATCDRIMENLFGSTRRQSWIAISDAIASDNSMPEHPKSIRTQYFNAIDRFTGAVKTGALFFLKAPVNHVFDFRLSIHKRLPEQLGASALLLLALKEWHNQGIRFGWGTNKGFGLTKLADHAMADTALSSCLQLEEQCDNSLQTQLNDYLAAQLTSVLEETHDEQ